MSWARSDDPLPQYRSVSWTAILAILLGLLSAVALFNPLLVAVAVAGTGLSLFALRQIAARPDVLSGRGLALAALFLSVFFMIFAPTRLGIRSRVLQQRGRELADTFLSLLKEGRTYDAHQLSNLKHRSSSQPPDLTVDPNKLTTDDLRGFEETKTIQMIKDVEHKFSFYAEGVEPSRSYSDMDIFIFRYRLVPEASTGKRPFPLWIAVSRSVDRGSGTAIWKVIDVQHVFKGAQ
jgi:hypothetical protein